MEKCRFGKITLAKNRFLLGESALFSISINDKCKELNVFLEKTEILSKGFTINEQDFIEQKIIRQISYFILSPDLELPFAFPFEIVPTIKSPQSIPFNNY